MQQRLERDLARRWASGELIGAPLRTTSGERLSILFPGRPGGGAGPDFRDAVIRLGDSRTLCGDVELHLRGGDWRAHGHADDPHYLHVILHVVYANDLQPTHLPDGEAVPVLALADVVSPPTLPLPPTEKGRWPCQQSTTRLDERELLALLDQLGEARFLEKAAAFHQQLTLPAEKTISEESARAARRIAELPVRLEAVGNEAPRHEWAWSAESCILFVALAEGMGYGREREAFRALGEQLVVLTNTLTSPAGAYEALLARLTPAPRLDRQRLAGLVRLAARWRERGPWPLVWALLSRPDPLDAREALLRALTISGELYQVTPSQRDAPGEAISAERAAILVWNVALPFAYAWAQAREDKELAERAHALALEFPGLSSNQITRAMHKHLLLPKHPRLALAQQGLQHVHKHWCREKLCAGCPCARLPANMDVSS